MKTVFLDDGVAMGRLQRAVRSFGVSSALK